MSRPAVPELVLASGNGGKLREFQALLGPAFRVRAQSEFGVVALPETGTTFLLNARLKAQHAARCTGLPALGDDSGLEVDALGGAPGVWSARYAGPDADDESNNARLLQELAGWPEAQRSARFRCVLVWLDSPDDPAPRIGEGVWPGRILAAPRGQGGFGYDPLFLDLQSGLSAAELSAADKNAVSHRGRAWAVLRPLFGYPHPQPVVWPGRPEVKLCTDPGAE